MGRPKAVKFGTIHEYTELFTRKTKMYCGVAITSLHLLKKTKEFMISIESWSFCMSQFKQKIKDFKPNFELPVITDEKTVAFLKEHHWENYVEKEIADEKDFQQAVEFFGKLLPGKKVCYFYEFSSLLSLYCNGNLVRYDKDGKIEPQTERDLRRIDYYNSKYALQYIGNPPTERAKELFDEQKAVGNSKDKEAERTKKYKAYRDELDKYIRVHANKSDIFKVIGENFIVCPYIFEDQTLGSYAHAGEFVFVITPDAVYFEPTRHY